MKNDNNRGRREMPGSKYTINEKIRFTEVRIIEGLASGVYRTSDALREAREIGLDLILISETANPPVCKVLDFTKFLYQEKQREKELKDRQSKVVVKEIQLSPNIGEHDYETKKKHAIKFLEKGNKVKVSVLFKGRSIMFKDKGELVLAKFATEIGEYGIPEALPKLVGKNMYFIIKPKKNK